MDKPIGNNDVRTVVGKKISNVWLLATELKLFIQSFGCPLHDFSSLNYLEKNRFRDCKGLR